MEYVTGVSKKETVEISEILSGDFEGKQVKVNGAVHTLSLIHIYTYEALKLFLLGAISRAFQPGCKFEIMLCLVGGQGAGKSIDLAPGLSLPYPSIRLTTPHTARPAPRATTSV